MKRINLDQAPLAVKKFLRDLPRDDEGVELELAGEVICKIIGADQMSDGEKDALLERGWELIRQVQERNKQVPAKVIQREVRRAVSEVRSRQPR
jgi:hypothetical protein